MREYHTPKAMKRVGDLFEKYKTRIKAPQASVEKEVVRVISEITGIPVTKKQVSYIVSTRTVNLQVPSVLKNELQFHYKAILEQLEAELGKGNCPIYIR